MNRLQNYDNEPTTFKLRVKPKAQHQKDYKHKVDRKSLRQAKRSYNH